MAQPASFETEAVDTLQPTMQLGMLSLVPELRPQEVIDINKFATDLGHLEQKDGTNILMLTLDHMNIIPKDTKENNIRDLMLENILAAQNDLEQYYKSCEKKGIRKGAVIDVLLQKSKEYGDNPILKTLESIISSPTGPIAKYIPQLIEADRITRMALIMEGDN